MEEVLLRMDMRGLGMGFARNGAAQHYKNLLTHKSGGRHAPPKANEEHAPPKANEEHASPKANEQEACKPFEQRLLQKIYAVAAGGVPRSIRSAGEGGSAGASGGQGGTSLQATENEKETTGGQNTAQKSGNQKRENTTCCSMDAADSRLVHHMRMLLARQERQQGIS